MVDLKKCIDEECIKFIFKDRNSKKEYLERLGILVKRGDNLDELIRINWEYEKSKNIIRNMFMSSDKFIRGISCKENYDSEIEAWITDKLGDFDWPYSAINYDAYVWGVIKDKKHSKLTKIEAENLVSKATIKFMRMKEINADRNDFIEYLIVKNNNCIIPTLHHRRGVDFFINGIPFDQKVSKGVGKKFKEEYGDNFNEIAKNRPELLAKSLYENQDEARFESNNRLLIINSNDLSKSDEIEALLSNIDFSKPLEIEFDYALKNEKISNYKVKCFVIYA